MKGKFRNETFLKIMAKMTHIKCHQMMYNGAGSGSLGAGHRSADVFLQNRPFNGAWFFFVAMICLVRL